MRFTVVSAVSADEKKAESSRSRTRPASFMAVPEDTDGFLLGVVASFFR
jgi:hypothetical protein